MSLPPVSIPPSALPQNSDRLTVLPLSDLHLPKPAARIILENRAYLDRMDYVVLLGDMVRCYGTDTEYEAVRGFIGGLGRPYTAVSGNHEWYFEAFEEDSGIYGEVWAEAPDGQQRASLAKFQRFYGVDSLWRSHSSPLGHFVFLSLDRVEVTKQECLSDAQLEFLAGEIERAGDRPLFVWCHAPLMLGCRLDMTYYDDTRTACIELGGEVRRALERRKAPTFWMSGHIHLHPDHYLFPPYRCSGPESQGSVWQIHCPDSWGYGRWQRSQHIPMLYQGLFSRHLEIDGQGVTFVMHDHLQQKDTAQFHVNFE